MAGLVYYTFPDRAKTYLTPLYVNVCYNFIPFFAQMLAYLFGLEEPPGLGTTYGGPCVFIGYTMVCMSHEDQREMAEVPLVGSCESAEMLVKHELR